MAQNTLLTIFVLIAALAIVLQALVMFGIYKIICRIRGDLESIRADAKQRFDPIVQSLTEIIADTREPLRAITGNLVEVSRVLRERTNSADAVLDEVLEKCRRQVFRIDQTISEAMDKIDKTTAVVQRSVMGPVLEVSALLKGLRTGLDFFLSKRRSGQSSDMTQDEQMFI